MIFPRQSTSTTPPEETAKPAETINWENDQPLFVDPESYELPTRGAVTRGVFEINGIRFPIPPQGISITEQNQNFNFETLRTRESTKIRSGHGRIDITVTALFTGNTTGSVELVNGIVAPADPLAAINETLMPILYSLKKMPLCFLDNELLRTTLPVVPGEVIGAFVRSVNIGTVPGMPYTLSAEFQFVWFNHRPFTPRLRFRKEWYDPANTVDQFTSLYHSVSREDSEGGGAEDDSGRFLFIKDYGHPGTVFNATAIHTWTENIREARPLLEWLWPYRYKSTNRAIRLEDQPDGRSEKERPYTERALAAMPPFNLESFDHNVAFQFMIPQAPGLIDTPEGKKSLTDIISKFTPAQKVIPTPAPNPSTTHAPPAGDNTSIINWWKPHVSGPSGEDVITLYKNPSSGRVLNPSEKAVASLIYTRMIDEGYTPAFAIAAIVQASYESGLNPTAAHKSGIAQGLFQLNRYVDRKGKSRGLGASDPKFMGGRIAGSPTEAAAEPDKYYNAGDANINISRIISLIRVNKDLRNAAKDKNLSPAECFEKFFWSGLGAGYRQVNKARDEAELAKYENLYAGRIAQASRRIPGWDSKAFNSGSRLPGRITASELDIAVGQTPLEQRFSELYNSEEALRIAMERHLPEAGMMPTQEELVQLTRDFASTTPDKQLSAELLALATAVSQNVLIVKHAITGKIAQLGFHEIDISEYLNAVVPMNLAVTFGTNFVMMPLDGHRFATTQYVGGQQTAGTISFRALTPIGRQFVRDFQSMVNAYETSAIHFREFAKRRGIEVFNPLLNSMNIQSILLETINVDTVTGSPDDLNVVMRIVDNTIVEEGQRPILAVEEVGFDTVGAQVLDLLIKKKYVGVTYEAFVQSGHQELSNKVLASFTGGSTLPDSNNIATEVYEDGLIVTGHSAPQKGEKGHSSLLEDLLSERSSLVMDSIPLLRRIKLPDGRYKFFYKDGKTTIISNSESDPLAFPERNTVPVSRTEEVLEHTVAVKFSALNYGPSDVAKTAVDALVELSGTRYTLAANAGLDAEVISSAQYSGEIGRAIPASSEMSRATFQVLYGDKTHRGLIASEKFNKWSTNHGRKLLSALGRSAGGNGDPDFVSLFASSMRGASYQKTNQAYPDLLLPPNPISGLCIDTNPDFFLVNESDVKLCQLETLKIIHGADTAATGVKGIGFAKGSNAIDYGHENFKDIYGVGSGTGLQAANIGRDNIYTGTGDVRTAVNNGVFKTKVDGKPESRISATPETNYTLASLPGREAKLQNNISERRTRENYDRKLSMEVHYSESAYKETLEEGFFIGTSDGEQLENLNKIQHVFNPKTYNEMFKTFCDRYKSDHYAVRRAFPTFKVFFVEEDGESDFSTPEGLGGEIINKLASTPSLDDFYGVNAIKEISIVHNKESAVSTCVIQVLDLDGVLYNRKFDAGNGGGPIKDLTGTINSDGSRVPENKLVDDSNPFYSTMIKEGMKVIVKFGYCNDPTELDTIFIGQVAQFEGNQVITIVCQSYGAELVAKTFGTDPTKNVDLWNTTTADLVHDTMDREEVRHFGRWRLSDIDLTGELFGHQKLRPDGRVKTVWTWRPSVVDDNIFIPPVEEYSSLWERLWGDLHYVFWNTTIWDVFKEMELRHPDYVAYPVPYGQGADARMTMFFGHPDMEYLSRPALDKFERDGEFTAGNVSQMELRDALLKVNSKLNYNSPPVSEQVALARGMEETLRLTEAAPENVDNNLRALAKSIGAKEELFVAWKPNGKRAFAEINRLEQEARAKAESEKGMRLNKDYSRIDSDAFYRTTVAWQGTRLRPFRNYELVTSLHDILKNNIRTDISESYNSVELHYTNAGIFSSVNFGTFDQKSPETLVVNADDNIKEHHIRRTIEAWPNCTSTNLARRYASQLLANSLKKNYRGELVILGKPHLKPYDIVWLNDTYSDMAGPIEIEEVVHTFSQETGLITEIVPNMIVSVAGDAKMLMVDAIGKFFDTTAKDFTTGAMLGVSVGLTIGGGALAYNAAKSFNKAAAFATNTGQKALDAAEKAGKFFNVLSEEGKRQAANLTAKVRSMGPKAENMGVNSNAAAANSLRPRGTGASTLTAGALQIATDTVMIESGQGGIPINGESVAGFATGLGASGLAAFLPITVGVSAIVAGGLLYKFLKYNTTREPIIITPLIKDGKPYIIGLEGFETDGLVCTNFDGAKKTADEKWKYFIDGIDEANNIVAAGWANFWAGE
jgi:hypothetical protein